MGKTAVRTKQKSRSLLPFVGATSSRNRPSTTAPVLPSPPTQQRSSGSSALAFFLSHLTSSISPQADRHSPDSEAAEVEQIRAALQNDPEALELFDSLVADFRDQVSSLSLRLPLKPEAAAEKYTPGAGIDPLVFLETHYGQYLAYFGASRNSMSQLDLQRFDKPLLTAVRNAIHTRNRQSGGSLQVAQVIPRQADLLSELLERVPEEARQNWEKIASALSTRSRRQA